MLNDLHKDPEFLIRLGYTTLAPELDDLDENDIEPYLLRILASDEDDERRFAAAGVLAGCSKADDDRLRIIMLLQAAMSMHRDLLTHVAAVHALRLMRIEIDVDIALLGIVMEHTAHPLARAIAAGALVRHEQFPAGDWINEIHDLAEHDDRRVRKLAQIALDDLAEQQAVA